MWEYVQGIPDGTALGKGAKQAMIDMGLPPLKGLAPGMIEDAKNALNPGPLVQSVFGSGYPECELREFQVGDAYGRIRDPSTNEPWIDNPDSAYKQGDQYYQKRWVLKKYISRDEWASTPKTYNSDGTKMSEEFHNLTKPSRIIAIGILCIIGFCVLHKKNKH
jgi:hypothetical protein